MKYFLVAVIAASASMLIAYHELASSFELGRWLWLSVSVFGGPLYALVMMCNEKKSVADVVFVFLVVVFTLLPLVLAVKRRSVVILSIGTILWIGVGYVMAIAIYI